MSNYKMEVKFVQEGLMCYALLELWNGKAMSYNFKTIYRTDWQDVFKDVADSLRKAKDYIKRHKKLSKQKPENRTYFL